MKLSTINVYILLIQDTYFINLFTVKEFDKDTSIEGGPTEVTSVFIFSLKQLKVQKS